MLIEIFSIFFSFNNTLILSSKDSTKEFEFLNVIVGIPAAKADAAIRPL